MEYYQYFLLKGSPFQPASPRSAVYYSPTHLEGLSTLESGLLGELTGLTMLTGEAGTGKTTLIYALLQRDYKRVRIAHISDPKLSFLEMMRVVLPQLNLYCPGTTKLDYLKTLDHLLDLHGNEERIAIVVDEAQVVSDEVLEELRLLSNRGQRNDRCLQLILIGQPELAERLKRPELRQLNQRISSRGVLKPLSPREAVMYVECMLSAQGGKTSTIFEPGALERLLRLSDGIPRKINMLCHGAMLAALRAGQRKVSMGIAKETAAEYLEAVGLAKPRYGFKLAAIGSTALASLMLLGLVYPNAWSAWVINRALSVGEVISHTTHPAIRAGRRQKAARIRLEAKNPALTPRPLQSVAVIVPPAMPPAVARTAASPATAAPERRGQIIVREGDTLENIAIHYLGSKSGIDQLMTANPHLTDINQLDVGQVIYLPPGITAKASHDRSEAVSVPQAKDPPDDR
jgi:general secretion pathway protein A